MRVCILFAFGLCLAACSGEEPPPAEAPAEVAESPPAEEEEQVDDELDNEDELPPPSGAELDEMEEGELEAACFAGHSAACDRLGH